MPAERLPMRKIREVLRLKYACGASKRVIAQTVGIGPTSVGEYVRRAAVVFIPLAGIVVSPQTAVPLLFVADNLATLHITLPSFRRCCWAEILPLPAGATLTVPLGVALLVRSEEHTS